MARLVRAEQLELAGNVLSLRNLADQSLVVEGKGRLET
jgi:hypothetical protein